MLAASATNGDVAVFSVDSQVQGKNSHLWSSGESTRAVNRICWHYIEPRTIGSAHQDGLVKLWDCRQKTTSASQLKCYQPRADAARDITFDPFHEHIIAASFENGQVMIWDRRAGDIPWMKFSAHLSGAQSLSWSPSSPWTLATGGRDTTIKVWELMASGHNNHSAGTLSPVEGIATSSHRPQFLINTPSIVSRISWRGTPHHGDQLASMSSDRGDISVWKLGYNHIPACILRGHQEEPCVGFAWLDSPVQHSVSAADWSPQDSHSAMIHSADDMEFNDGNHTPHLNQHMVSAGKEGLVAIQDIRNGYFPRQHMSRNVAAISARGHIAFHLSNLHKVAKQHFA